MFFVDTLRGALATSFSLVLSHGSPSMVEVTGARVRIQALRLFRATSVLRVGKGRNATGLKHRVLRRSLPCTREPQQWQLCAANRNTHVLRAWRLA